MKMRLLVVFLLSIYTSFGQIPTNSKKSSEYRAVKYELYKRLVGEYEKHSQDKPEVKKEISILIDEFSRLHSLTGAKPTYEELAVKVKTSLKDKSNDPLSNVIMGNIIMYGGDDRQSDFNMAFKLLKNGEAKMAESKYSLFAKMLSALWLRKTIYRSQSINGKEENAIMERYKQTVLDYITSETPENEQRFVAGWADDFLEDRQDFKKMENFYNQFIKNSSKVKPWLKELITGAFNIDKAWHHRGGGYSNTVNEDGWKLFSKHLKIAAEHLKKAHSLKPERPEAAAKLIAVSMGGGTDEPVRFWFDKAVAAEVDYKPAYTAILWAYRPRWGGSHQKMLSFGRECMESGLYDTVVPYIMVQAITDVKSETDYNYIAENGLYNALHEVLKKYEEQDDNRFRPYDHKNHLRALHFCYAYKIEKYSHVRKLYQLYGDSVFVSSTFKSFDIDLKPAVSLAYAMSGDASGLVSKLHEELTWEKFNSKNKIWRSEKELELLVQDLEDAKGMTSEKESEYYFDKLTKITEIEKQFNTGKWVNLKFQKGLPTWKVFGGNWDIIDENTIQANTLDTQRQYLSSEAFFKPPYMIELTVESIKSNWRGRHLQAGLMIGRMYGTKTGRTFWADGLRKRAGIGIPNELPSGINLKNRSKKNKITVLVWNGRHEFYINDGENYYFESDPKFSPLRVSLGIMPWYGISGVVKYSNPRIKKLTYGPPPNTTDKKELVAYYESRAAIDPLPLVYEKLAETHNGLEQYDKAIDALNEKDKHWQSWWNPFYKASTLIRKGEFNKISELYEIALKRSGNSSYAKNRTMNDYAWFLATCMNEKFRDPKKSLQLAQQLARAKAGKNTIPYHMSTLSAAHALNGNFKEAVDIARKAEKLTESQSLKKRLNERIALYEKGELYLFDPHKK